MASKKKEAEKSREKTGGKKTTTSRRSKSSSSIAAADERSTQGEAEEAVPAPQSGSCRAEGGTILVSWPEAPESATTPKDVEYVLVRKKDGIPESSDDGCVVVDAPILQYEDIRVEPGYLYGYSVFVRRNGRMEAQACPCGMCRIAVPPRRLSLCGLDSSIELSWECAPGVDSYLLVRKNNGIPADLQDGVAIQLPAGIGYHVDTGLSNGCTYGYLLAHVYREADGSLSTCAGAIGQAQPQPAPEILQANDWSWSCRKKKLSLAWKLAPGGEILWYVLPFLPGTTGSRVHVEALTKDIGPPAVCCNTEVGKAEINITFEGYRYLVPIVRNDSQALLCEARRILYAPAVEKLQAHRTGGNILLSWDWPASAKKVWIACSRSAAPKQIDSPDIFCSFPCSETAYRLHHFYSLKNLGEEPLHISVFAIYEWGDECIYSPPQSILTIGAGGRRVIHYEIKSKGGLFGFGQKSRTLHITAEDGRELPELLLIKKKGSPPHSPEDGIRMMYLPAGANTIECPLDITPSDRGCYLRLFVKDSSRSVYYTLTHPEFNHLKID